MRNTLAALLLIITSICATAQTSPSSNLQLGYQEFPTSIRGHAADSLGNQYYTGHFKGQFTVKGQVLAQGNGLEDVFWAKTDSAGKLLQYKTFGGTKEDFCYSNALAINKSSTLLMGIGSHASFSLDATLFPPQQFPGGAFGTWLIAMDTNGKLLWRKKTTLQNFRIHSRDDLFHVVANIPSHLSNNVWVEDSLITNSTPNNAIVHLVFDGQGKLLHHNTITTRPTAFDNVHFNSTHTLSNGKIMMEIDGLSDSILIVGNKAVKLTSKIGSYRALVILDSVGNTLKTRVLNPESQELMQMYDKLPLAIGDNDSVYTVITNDFAGAPPLNFDRFLHPKEQNVLYVFDSNLVVCRQVQLGTNKAGSYGTHLFKRKIIFKNILVEKNILTLMGQYAGINESPVHQVFARDTLVKILPDYQANIDLNGPSSSFIAMTDLNGHNAVVNWYGTHYEYELTALNTEYHHKAGNGRIAFSISSDNSWNPWLVGRDATTIAGTMQPVTDGPEQIQMLQYFQDGSRILTGYAKGKTALDPVNSRFPKSMRRNDVFLTRVDTNNKVIWYKRWQSTLQSANIRALEVSNGKAWFLVTYTGTQNDSNFIKIGNNLYSIGPNGSLFGSVDTAGNLQAHNLSDPAMRPMSLRHFGLMPNGDPLLITGFESRNYPGLVAGPGLYLFQINRLTGSVASVRKLIGSNLPAVFSIQSDSKGIIYITGMMGTDNNALMYLCGTSGILDTLNVDANGQSPSSLIKMSWNRLLWHKRFTTTVNSYPTRQMGDLLLLNDRPVLTLAMYDTLLLWDRKPIYKGTANHGILSLLLDSSGNLTTQKMFPSMYLNYVRNGGNGSIYYCGFSNSSFAADSINVQNSGGSDAISLVVDSSFKVKKVHRLGSSYFEVMYDMAIYKDSIVSFAYNSQSTPQLFGARTTGSDIDREADAVLGTLIIRNNVTTSLRDPLPPVVRFAVAPNPIQNNGLQLQVQSNTPLQTVCTVHQVNGMVVNTRSIQLTTGNNNLNLPLPATTAKGVYYVTLTNKAWKATRAFVVR